MCKTFFFNLKIATHDFQNYVEYKCALSRMTYSTQMIAHTDFVSRHCIGRGSNAHINNPGHMTKMGAMPIFGINPRPRNFSEDLLVLWGEL